MRVLYFCPGSKKGINNKWLYGYDIYLMLKDKFDIKLVDGSDSFEMWDGIDVYLRPTRHDGISRMVIEATNLNIPVIWSYETGKYVEPNVNEIEKRLIEITKV